MILLHCVRYGMEIYMIRMKIEMNTSKIDREKQMHSDDIFRILDVGFSKLGLRCMETGPNSRVYCDNGHANDYGSFGIMVNALKKTAWFMENVSVWTLCESDDPNTPEDFIEEDLLIRYKQKQLLGK